MWWRRMWKSADVGRKKETFAVVSIAFDYIFILLSLLLLL